MSYILYSYAPQSDIYKIYIYRIQFHSVSDGKGASSQCGPVIIYMR